MPQRNIKDLQGLAADRMVGGIKGVAKKTANIIKSTPKKWSKYATTNRMIDGKEVVDVGDLASGMEYSVKKIGQTIGKAAGRLAYGPMAPAPKSVRPNTKKK